jgi:transcriptional regulator with XRE-family HTH domain
MVALPCCYLTLKTGKPRNPAYPERLNTWGDHVRQRRLNLGMHQKDVAALVNATTSTVTNWEKNRTSPRLYLIPQIIHFLGYDPFPPKVTNIAERIKNYRRLNGFSLRGLAEELGIDPGTLAKWENGESRPQGKLSLRLVLLLR